MTNAQDNSSELPDLREQQSRAASYFHPKVTMLRLRLSTLLAAEATGADEDLRRSRIIDLRRQIATATTEGDAPTCVESAVVLIPAPAQAPRHMSTGKSSN